MAGKYINTRPGYAMPHFRRAELIKAAGFDGVLIWMGPDEEVSLKKRAKAYLDAGLEVENLHAPVAGMNDLWLPGSAGEEMMYQLQESVEIAGDYGVKTVVMHLSRGYHSAPLSGTGMERMEKLIRMAEDNRVRLAIENVKEQKNLKQFLDQYRDCDAVGLCFDSGHQCCWASERKWLREYKDRLYATHLNDNDGNADLHLMPMDGTVDWGKVVKELKESSYQNKIAMEVKYDSSDRYSGWDAERFLRIAFEKASLLERMLCESE